MAATGIRGGSGRGGGSGLLRLQNLHPRLQCRYFSRIVVQLAPQRLRRSQGASLA